MGAMPWLRSDIEGIAPKGRSYRAAGADAMADKKAYPLRINADVLAAVQRWGDDELRSLNAQIEYVLRDALRKAGRLPEMRGNTKKEDGT